MGYSDGYLVRPIAGRLALDFLNTADWSEDDAPVHEKIETLKDAAVWMKALDLPALRLPDTAEELRGFRRALRAVFLRRPDCDEELNRVNAALQGIDGAGLARTGRSGFTCAGSMSLLQMIAVSALSLLADPREAGRIKTCPGPNCGWLFLDETKNARRRWCSMETCGNRAKARRSYERSKGRSG